MTKTSICIAVIIQVKTLTISLRNKGDNMKKLTIEEKIILQIALANFIQSRQDAKENSYIPVEYLNRDIKIAQDLQEKITYFID